MSNLFVDDLDRLTLAALIEFLGLDGPIESRAREGFRLDFKGVDPSGDLNRQSICKAAAAFSNTHGGLLIVGVRGEGGFASELVGVRQRGELKTRLDGILRAGVQPPPRFSVGVTAIPGAAAEPRDVGVIRVEEGGWPPYAYSESKRQTPMVRSNDESEPALLVELDALYAKRARLNLGSPKWNFPMEPNIAKPPWLRVVFHPIGGTQALLHRDTDDALVAAHDLFFPRTMADIAEVDRDQNFTEFRVESATTGRRLFRGMDDGTIIVAADIERVGQPNTNKPGIRAVFLCDLADDLVRASKAAHQAILSVMPTAVVDVHVQLNLDNAQQLINGAADGMKKSLAINMASLRDQGPLRNIVLAVQKVDASELAEPSAVVARLLIQLLRRTRAGSIRFEELWASIRANE